MYVKYVGLQFVHLHRDIMHNAHKHISKHVMTLIHAQLGDVKAPGRSKNKDVSSHVFWGDFCERAGCRRQAQGVGLHRAAWACQTEGHLRNHEVTSVCVC